MLQQQVRAKLDDDVFRRSTVIIDSMTPRERRFPALIDSSRKRRIAADSGTAVPDVNRVLKQHKQVQKVAKKTMRQSGMQNVMRGLEDRRPFATRPALVSSRIGGTRRPSSA